MIHNKYKEFEYVFNKLNIYLDSFVKKYSIYKKYGGEYDINKIKKLLTYYIYMKNARISKYEYLNLSYINEISNYLNE